MKHALRDKDKGDSDDGIYPSRISHKRDRTIIIWKGGSEMNKEGL